MPLSKEVSKILTSTEILILKKTKDDIKIEMIEARKIVKELESKIRNIR